MSDEATQLKVGAWVRFSNNGKYVEGEILTYREDKKNPGRSRLTLRDTEQNIFCLWADQLAGGVQVQGFQVNLGEAEEIARLHLAGLRIEMPLEEQFNKLAAAILQLRGSTT